MGVIVFSDNEAAYLRWVAKHPNGFVVNTRRELDPDYLVLHRATCATVNKHRGMDENPGGFTERNFQKICCDSLPDLVNYLRGTTGLSDPFSKECSKCTPS
jgi:hypothetical protein